MGIPQELGRLYNLQIGSDAIRQVVLPLAASPTLTANAAGSTYGAWAALALAATVLVDTLIVGVVANGPSAADEYTVDIGSCIGFANVAALNAGGAPAIAAAHRQELRFSYNQVTAAGVVCEWTTWLYSPVYIPALVEIVGRMYGITAVAVTLDVSVICLQLW